MRTAARTAFFMILLTLFSKLIGFVREILLANFYGTGYIMDSYVMATSIPGIIFGGIFAAISTAYMPVFSKKVECEGTVSANKFTSEVMNLALFVAIVASIIGIIFSDQVVHIFAGGFKGDTAALTSFYVKITFSYVVFSSTIALLEAYLQYKGVFLPQVVVGYLQNAVIIIVIIISAYTSHYILVFGWLLGYAARMFIIIVQTRKKGFNYTFTLNVESTIRNIILLSVPVFIGSSLSQINMFVDRTLASGLPEGSVSALNYGSILITMISGLTIAILVTISYPKLAQASSKNDFNRFSDILSTGINLIAIIAIPCSLGAMVYSKDIVQLIFERGAFDSHATVFTSSAFFYYSIGLFFTSLASLLTQAFYSLHNMKTPMIFSGLGVILNLVFNLILIRSMAHNGLALATSIAAMGTATCLYIGFKKKYRNIQLIRSRIKFMTIIICGAISVFVSWIFYTVIGALPGIPHTVVFVAAVIIAGLVYLIELFVFKIEEIQLLKQIIKR